MPRNQNSRNEAPLEHRIVLLPLLVALWLNRLHLKDARVYLFVCADVGVWAARAFGEGSSFRLYCAGATPKYSSQAAPGKISTSGIRASAPEAGAVVRKIGCRGAAALGGGAAAFSALATALWKLTLGEGRVAGVASAGCTSVLAGSKAGECEAEGVACEGEAGMVGVAVGAAFARAGVVVLARAIFIGVLAAASAASSSCKVKKSLPKSSSAGSGKAPSHWELSGGDSSDC